MVAPKMFSNKQRKPIIVYILKNINTNEIFDCSFCPKHFFVKEAAEYTKKFMELPEYEVIESEWSPDEGTYE